MCGRKSSLDETHKDFHRAEKGGLVCYVCPLCQEKVKYDSEQETFPLENLRKPAPAGERTRG